MKVRSPLADMDVRLGAVSRTGNDLILMSGPGSSIDAEITVSAREVLHTIGLVLTSAAGLTFVLGLPWFWLRQRLRGGMNSSVAVAGERPVDINKPW